MRKCISFLLLILVSQFTCLTTDFAQQNNEEVEIRDIIQKYLDSIQMRNLNSLMKQISANFFYVYTDGETFDYSKFYTRMEEHFRFLSETYADFSISELEITNLVITDNKANLEIVYNCKGFNLKTVKVDSSMVKAFVSLIKEDSSWKFVYWEKKKELRKN